MNTFKTTAYLLSFATAGGAMEDGDPYHTPPRTPQHQINAVSLYYDIETQQLFTVVPPNTPNGQQGFITPQNQIIQFTTPNTPVRSSIDEDETTDAIDRLAESIDPSLTPKKKSVGGSAFRGIRDVNFKGKVSYTIAPKNEYTFDGNEGNGHSPQSVTGITRLESDMFTPAMNSSVNQFAMIKSVNLRAWVDPYLEDERNEYLPSEESSVISVRDVDTAMCDISLGSFVIHQPHPLESGDDDSAMDDSSFQVHGGAHLLGIDGNEGDEQDGRSVVSGITEEYDPFGLNASHISYVESERNVLDMSGDELDFFDEK